MLNFQLFHLVNIRYIMGSFLCDKLTAFITFFNILYVKAKPYDFFFLLRPTLLVPVWLFHFLGFFKASNGDFLHVVLKLPWSFYLSLLAYSLLIGGVYILNQIFDVESDRINRKLFLLPEGIISIKAAWILFFIVIAISNAISIRFGLTYMVLWFLSLLLGVLYSAPPFKFKGRPFLDVISNALGYGLINFLIGWASSYQLDKRALLFSLPYIFAVASVFLMTTIPDIEGDRRTNEITTGVKLGEKKTALLALIMLIVSLLIGLALRDFLVVLAAALTIPPFYLALYKTTDFFVKLSYRIAGFIFASLVAIHCPPFLILVFLTYWVVKLYYLRRFGLNYPSLKGR